MITGEVVGCLLQPGEQPRGGCTRAAKGRGRVVQVLAVALLAAATVPALAQDDPAAQEIRRQQERERILREQQETTPDVRLEGDAAPLADRLPVDESPCFQIRRIALEGDEADRFQWALDAADPAGDRATGSCLGTHGVNVTLKRVQNAIIGRGFVTTRILAAPQDLKQGTLTLTVAPGRIRSVRFAEGAPSGATAWNAVPASPGDLLNLRDIEQALENFQRLPTVTADIQIAPAQGEGAGPGESDLVIAWQQRAPARLNLTLDDAGSPPTGKLQGGATVSLDNPLRWNDLFYVNFGHDVLNGGNKGTSSRTVHYDVPFGYWLLGATVSNYDYHQEVAGAYETYVYSGSSSNAELQLSRLFYRNATIKVGAYGRGWRRESDNFIDDTEVLVQRRRTAGWELGLTYKQFIGTATFDARLAYRRGTGAFGSLAAPEEAFGEGTSRPGLVSADMQLSIPFQWGSQRLRYSGSWRAQWDRTPLVPQDRFAIGGRYTVRGFDGDLSLSGERGWLLRNDLGLVLGGGQELYLGVDYGHIGGPSTQWQVGDELAGAVLGLRGGHGRLTWDLFFGAPVYEPDGFATAYTTTGFSLGWAY